MHQIHFKQSMQIQGQTTNTHNKNRTQQSCRYEVDRNRTFQKSHETCDYMPKKTGIEMKHCNYSNGFER